MVLQQSDCNLSSNEWSPYLCLFISSDQETFPGMPEVDQQPPVVSTGQDWAEHRVLGSLVCDELLDEPAPHTLMHSIRTS